MIEMLGMKAGDWIGSQEVCTIINKIVGVDCKILSMKSGTEFKNHAEELIDHFNNIGTPIMIGGGVLAYTLLGVEKNKDKGTF